MEKKNSTTKKMERIADSENQKMVRQTLELKRETAAIYAEHRALARERWPGLLASYELPNDSEGDRVLLDIFRQQLRLKGTRKEDLSRRMAELYSIPKRKGGKLFFDEGETI